MKKFVVTGGAGFIGSHMVDLLVDNGCDVLIIDDLSSGDLNNIKTHVSSGKVKFLKLALHTSDENELTELLLGYDGVFHMAAFARIQPSIDDPLKYNTINVDGTLKLLIAARNANIKKVVYSASSAAYGNKNVELPTKETNPFNPVSPYGLQKLIGEQYCRVFSEVYGMKTACLRYFNVFGDRMPSKVGGAYRLIIPIWKELTEQNMPLTITNDGEQRRDFVHVTDVTNANWLSMQSDQITMGGAVNIGSGTNISINELAKIWGGETVNIGNRLEPRETLADISKAKELLGWEPQIEIKEWITNYVRGIKK